METDMTFESIAYTVDEQIATITLNRPEEMNAITEDMVTEIVTALRTADEDPSGICTQRCTAARLPPGIPVGIRPGHPTARRRNWPGCSITRTDFSNTMAPIGESRATTAIPDRRSGNNRSMWPFSYVRCSYMVD